MEPNTDPNVIPMADFQKQVLEATGKTKTTVEDLITRYDNLDKETKKTFEELTALKNGGLATQADINAALASIKKIDLQLRNELRNANGDPVKRISGDEELRTKLNAFVRHVVGAPLGDAHKALVSGSTPGSTFIDDALANEIFDTLATFGIWNTFGVRRVGTKITKFPVKTARASAGFIMTEGDPIPEDTAKAGTSVNCEIGTIASLLTATMQLIEDSEFDVTADVLNDFAESAAERLDFACLRADGTADATNGGYTGIFNGGTAATATATRTTVEALKLEDILNVLLAVDPIVLTRRAAWWMHPQILVRMLAIKDDNGRPIFLTATEAPSFGAMGSILGYPVIPSFAAPSANAASAKVAAFGDPNGLVVGVRKDFEFDGSDHAGWTTYSRVFRGVMRAGVRIRRAQAFGVLTLPAS